MTNRYSLLSLFLLVGFVASGQNITIIPGTEITVSIKANEPEVIVHAKVKNNGTKSKDFKWERTENCLPGGWTSLICDKNACYASTTNQSPQDFTLEPGEEGTFDIHVKASAIDGGGQIQVKITDISDATNTATALVKVNDGCVSSTGNVAVQPVKLYPNPATNGWFKLENADHIAAVRLMTLDGRQLCHFEATPDHQYQIGEYPSAAYILILEDKAGKTVGAMNLKKI